MARKQLDANAKAALNEFKYEMANELGLDTFEDDTNFGQKKGSISSKKLIEAAEKQLGSKR
ncbi:MAG: Small, acid-soluble spore protein alpha/beta type [Candidatus Petromonas sp.]|jgi:hypothetical protein|nr:Small, acid-soluble spore protein alpha/beta type [Candidatus Petromonas sp.]